jgi:hypothetical protein
MNHAQLASDCNTVRSSIISWYKKFISPKTHLSEKRAMYLMIWGQECHQWSLVREEHFETLMIVEVIGNCTSIFLSSQIIMSSEMVMQYLCLFWATNNNMYTNYCVYKETVLSNGQLSVAQRPPCRSFCIQVIG